MPLHRYHGGVCNRNAEREMKGSDGTGAGRNNEGSKRNKRESAGTGGTRQWGEVGKGLRRSIPGALQGDDKLGRPAGYGGEGAVESQKREHRETQPHGRRPGGAAGGPRVGGEPVPPTGEEQENPVRGGPGRAGGTVRGGPEPARPTAVHSMKTAPRARSKRHTQPNT